MPSRTRGAEIRQVDTEDVESLRSAFEGAYGVFNVHDPMTSSIEAEVRQGHNVAVAAAAVGVGHVVYGAAVVCDEVTGVDSWDSKLLVARRFRDLGFAPGRRVGPGRATPEPPACPGTCRCGSSHPPPAQVMQVRATGRASSRSTAMSRSQDSQTPYVPAATRFSAASSSARCRRA